MQQPLERIETDTEFPEAADVVVIGGGIAGISTAYFLAKRGVSVVVLEKGLVGAEQSSRNWGWCRQQGRDIAELDLARLSMSLWETLPAEIGADLGFRKVGVAFVTDSAAELAAWERWRDIAREHQIHSQLLTAAEAQAKTPGSARRWVGGLQTPSDGCAEPSKVVPLLAQAARRLGAVVVQNCAVRLMEKKGGRVAAVVTERGAIRTNAVLCAGGAWSSLFCRRHGVDLPQAVVYGSVARTTRAVDLLSQCVSTPGFSVRRRTDDGYTVAMSGRGTVHLTPSLLRYGWKFLPTFLQRRRGLKIRLGKAFLDELLQSSKWSADEVSPFEKTRILDPLPDAELLGRALGELRATFPELGEIGIEGSWGGVIDSMPDAVPVISPVAALPGFFLSTGFSGHGFGVGPAAGLAAADMITGSATAVDLTPFRYSRLFDGTRLRPDSKL
ncbi:FAD-binding oxidoreductase [Bradyrhizobium lablabi]|uniref:NAD(P)/FAD-dependent oxidoreductase n=1 Tax=Bradyrhizobium lablabi TaxID=722472 RepID=UPI001BA667CE|nr:FAD-binding oxidoreductase [Bradyrhizobium lablabi]MBR1125930.1 FAD-binding oxidoreductase [Bradyrhizobium lablabi]